MYPGNYYETEVLVVGGGPAGLAAALAARQAGFEVMVADCAHPPIDKACGEGIMPDGLVALRRLGVTLDLSLGANFSGVRLINGEQQVEAKFPRGMGVSLRRTDLHQQLLTAAAQAGVRLRWGCRVRVLPGLRVLLDGESVRYRWVIGADGQNSRLRYFAGIAVRGSERVRFGSRQHFRVKPWSDQVEVHWSDCGEIYVTPVAEDAVCLVLISSRKSLPFTEALTHFPVLAARLRAAVPEDRPRGAVTASRRLRRVYDGDLALIGEAAGSVDAITGEGLAIAF